MQRRSPRFCLILSGARENCKTVEGKMLEPPLFIALSILYRDKITR
jgi:hypothetical protein